MEANRPFKLAFVAEKKDLPLLIETKLLQDVHIEVDHFEKNETMISSFLEDKDYDAIIIEISANTLALLKFFASMQSKVPLILIENTLPLENIPYPELRIVGKLKLKEFMEQFPEVILKLLSVDPVTSDVSRENYVRIRTEFLGELSPLKSDVFIRLSGGKMIRVFKQGAKFGRDEVARYVNHKRLTYLYVPKETSKDVVRDLKARLLGYIETSITEGQDSTEVLAVAHETVQELVQQFGFTEETQALVKGVVDKVLAEVEKNPGLSKAWQSLCEPQAKYISSHSMLTGQLACAIASKFDWPSNTTYSKLTYAAFFHDFSLKDDVTARYETMAMNATKVANLPQSVREAFLQHTQNSANLLTKFPSLPQDVDIIIRQHHELPDGSGFPRALQASNISPLASVFIVAHEFISFVIENRGTVDFEKFKEVRPDLHSHPKFLKYIEILPKIISSAGAPPEKKTA